MLEVIKRRYVKGQLQFISISIDAVKVSPVIDMFLFTFGVIIYLMLTSLGSVEWNMLHFSISIYVPISSPIYHYYSNIFFVSLLFTTSPNINFCGSQVFLLFDSTFILLF